jgi:hypothetical protein
MVESERQYSLRMAEYAREIRESCAKILELLQEEIDATEKLNDTVQISDAMLPSPTQPLVNEKFNVESMNLNNDFNSKMVDSTIVINEDDIIHRLSPRRETPLGGNVVSLRPCGDTTQSFTVDAALVNTYPYDPGPLDPPSLNKVSNSCDSLQLKILIRTLSQFDDPIALQLVNMLRENSISNESIITHVFCLWYFL